MALEQIEINKDNLNVDTFKTLIANVAEQINIKLQNEDGISLEDIDKALTQVNNAFSMLVTVNSDTNDRDISAIEQMKVNFDNAIADIQTKLDNGDFDGKDGKDGEDGQSFTFDMFTPEQLDSLKVKGDDGQSFTFDMFTSEQLDSLKVKGDDGIPFTFDMFTPEQLESLKVRGDDGTPFTYDMFTSEQLESLKVDSLKTYIAHSYGETIATNITGAFSNELVNSPLISYSGCQKYLISLYSTARIESNSNGIDIGLKYRINSGEWINFLQTRHRYYLNYSQNSFPTINESFVFDCSLLSDTDTIEFSFCFGAYSSISSVFLRYKSGSNGFAHIKVEEI